MNNIRGPPALYTISSCCTKLRLSFATFHRLTMALASADNNVFPSELKLTRVMPDANITESITYAFLAFVVVIVWLVGVTPEMLVGIAVGRGGDKMADGIAIGSVTGSGEASI